MAVYQSFAPTRVCDTEAERDLAWGDGTLIFCKDTNKLYTIKAGAYVESKALAGLGNVDNTSDANKPVSTDIQTELDLKENLGDKGQPDGYAELDGDGLVPLLQLPDIPAVATWGAIIGTLATQTDLQGELDDKADALTADQNYVTDAQLVVVGNTSGTNSGNQTTIVGISGTLAEFNTALSDANFASGGGTATGTNTGDNTNFAAPLGSDDNYVTDAEKVVIGNTSGTNSGDNAINTLYSGLAASKQDTLVSATNIKTINGATVLGAGDLVVSGSAADQNPDLLVQAADYNLLTNRGMVVPSDYEIGDGFVLDLAVGALLDVV